MAKVTLQQIIELFDLPIHVNSFCNFDQNELLWKTTTHLIRLNFICDDDMFQVKLVFRSLPLGSKIHDCTINFPYCYGTIQVTVPSEATEEVSQEFDWKESWTTMQGRRIPLSQHERLQLRDQCRAMIFEPINFLVPNFKKTFFKKL